MTRYLLAVFKVCVPLAAALFVGRMIHGSWHEVRAEPWQLDAGPLALSFVLAAAWHLGRPFGWTRLIRGFGHNLPFWEVYGVYRKSEVSRYVPGGIWQFASRIYLLRRFGVGPAPCLAATVLDMTLAALASLVASGWFAGTAAGTLGTWQRTVVLLFPLASCAVVYPRVLNAWAAPLARFLRQPYRPLRLGFRQLASIWALYAGAWVLLGSAMACLARALLPDIGAADFGYIAGCYALAWMAALLTVVSPAGIGVREGILGLLLSRVLPVGTAMTLAVAMRLWVVCMELVWFIPALLPLGKQWRPEGSEG